MDKIKAGDLIVKYWNAVKLMKIIEAGTRLYDDCDMRAWVCQYAYKGGKN